MNRHSIRIMTLASVMMLGLVLFLGCVSNPPANTTNNTYVPPVNNTTSGGGGTYSPDDAADELAGGTGNGPNDISDSDLDAMQSDLDDLDTAVDESQESDI